MSDLSIGPGNRYDVNLQDQTTRPIDTRINRIVDDTITLAAVPTVDQYDLTLTTGHGVIIGNNLAFLEQNGDPQIYFGEVLNVVGDVVTMDTPVPFAFTPATTVVLSFNSNLNVDGSGTTVVSSLINVFDVSLDLTRFLFHITDGSAMDDGLFGSRTKLTRGIVLRKKLVSGNYINYFNIKTNGEFGELGYDIAYDEKAPAGLFGFRARLTYAGQAKHGVVIRLRPGEIIELLIQDDITTQTSFFMMVQGHVVD
ncbi:hypothetical protein KA005_22455 [bacterium]|nr:hypothetical protein [bacterium]